MPKQKHRPKKLSKQEQFKLRFAEGVMSIIRLIAILLLFISAYRIIDSYTLLMFWGAQPSALIQTQINFSIEIFIGAGLVLISYSYDTEELVKRLLNVSDRQLFKQNK